MYDGLPLAYLRGLHYRAALAPAFSTDIPLPGAGGGGILSDEQWHKLFAAVDAAVKDNPDHPLLVGRVDGNPVQIRPPWRPSAAKWMEGVNSVGASRYAAGVRNPRADFKAAALANNDGWKKGVTQAVANDKFAKGMGAVNVDEAIETAATQGAATYASGAAARVAKFERNVDAIAAKMGAVVETVRRMPASTPAEREARMIAQVRGSRQAAGGQ